MAIARLPWQGGKVKLYGMLSVVCCLLSVVSATEFMIDTLGTHTQLDPTVAFDGENFLVVWADYRPGGEGIYCSRVNPEAGVLDPVGFPVSATGNLPYYPAVAFDGTNYLVVWEQWDANLTTSDIHAARVSPQGRVLDSVPIVVSDAPSYQIASAVTFDDENYLVVWYDRRHDGGDIYGARVTPSGVVLDSGGFVISDAPGKQLRPKVAFDGTNLLVVWFDGRYSESWDIYAARVTPQGEVLDSAGFAISDAPGKQILPRVAFDGENYLVVWGDDRNPPRDVYGARVDRNGTVLDPTGIVVCADSVDLYWPAIAFNGSDYLVAWMDWGAESNLFGASVVPDGLVSDKFPLVVARYTQQRPALTHGGGKMLVVYRGHTYIYQGKLYASDRVWGKFGPFPGVKEAGSSELRAASMATVVRGILFMPDFPPRHPTFTLHNSTGRKVLDLKPGTNDVRRLSPGVYFIRREDRRESVRIVLVE